MEKNRSRRFETASGLALDLLRYLADEPVQACPPSPGYRVRKFVRRNKTAVLATSLILLALAAGMIGTTIGLIRTEKARLAEADQRQVALSNERKARASAAAEKKAADTVLAREAETQANRLAWQSAATLPTNPGLALLLAIEGTEHGGPRLTIQNNTLLAALGECREVRTLMIRQTARPADPWRFAVNSVSFDRDGIRLATTASGVDHRSGRRGEATWTLDLNLGIAHVWETETGRLLSTMPAPPGQTFADAQLSPDGRLLVCRLANSVVVSTGAGSDREKWERWLYTDRVVRVWDVGIGRELHILRGHRAGVFALGFSPDSQRLFTASWDNTIRTWELSSGRQSGTISTGPAGLESAAFSPDGRRIATVSSAIEHRITYADDPGQSPPPSMDSRVVQDGSPIMYSPETRVISSLDITTSNEVGQWKGHDDDVTTAGLSPDGRLLVTASLDGTARLWHTEDLPGYGTIFASAGPAAAASYSPDGRLVLVAHGRAYEREEWDSFASIWDVARGDRRSVLRGQDRPGASPLVKTAFGGVRIAQFSPDGKRVLTVSDDRHVGVIKPNVSGDVLSSTPKDKWPFAEEIPLRAGSRLGHCHRERAIRP